MRDVSFHRKEQRAFNGLASVPVSSAWVMTFVKEDQSRNLQSDERRSTVEWHIEAHRAESELRYADCLSS